MKKTQPTRCAMTYRNSNGLSALEIWGRETKGFVRYFRGCCIDSHSYLYSNLFSRKGTASKRRDTNGRRNRAGVDIKHFNCWRLCKNLLDALKAEPGKLFKHFDSNPRCVIMWKARSSLQKTILRPKPRRRVCGMPCFTMSPNADSLLGTVFVCKKQVKIQSVNFPTRVGKSVTTTTTTIKKNTNHL